MANLGGGGAYPKHTKPPTEHHGLYKGPADGVLGAVRDALHIPDKTPVEYPEAHAGSGFGGGAYPLNTHPPSEYQTHPMGKAKPDGLLGHLLDHINKKE